jgi:hypothetical protein
MFSYKVKSKADIRDGNEYKIRKCLALKFHGSDHQQIILHLNKIAECLKMTTFKIVFTFDVFVLFFLVLKPQFLNQPFPDFIFVSIPYIGLVFTSYENIWLHFTESKSCQIIESILKYKNGFLLKQSYVQRSIFRYSD